MFSFAHREAKRKGRARLISPFSPPVSPCRAIPRHERILLFSALLSLPGFSTGRDSVAESEASLGEPSETRLFLFLVCADVPAASQQVGKICAIIHRFIYDTMVV